MKHKLLTISTVACLGLACLGLSSCSTESNTIANPWTEYFSFNAAKSHSEFTLDNAPNTYEGETITYTGYLSSVNMSQIIYGDDYCILRKAKVDDEDISGDYNDYSVVEKTTIDGNKVVLKGNGNKSVDCYNLALWHSGKYSYSISCPNGISKKTVAEYMELLK